MCYHISLTKKDESIKKRFDIAPNQLKAYQPFYHRSGFENNNIYIIKDMEPYNFLTASWGMLPETYNLSQRKDFLKRTNTLNARAEGLLDSPLYKEPIEHNRCVILADGFFEPHSFNNKNYPYYIQYEDQSIMGIAGIYSKIYDGIYTVSLITTKANSYFEGIHNKKNKFGEYRMPLVLDASAEKKWLNSTLPFQEVNSLLSSFTNKKFQSYTVSKDVMSSHIETDYRDILKKVEYQELNTLF